MTPTVRLSVAGGLATLLASLALMPVTGQDPWLLPGAIVIALVVAVGRLADRVGVPRLLVPLVQVVAAAWWVVLVMVRDTAYALVLPTPASVEALVDLHRVGFEAVNAYGAPTPPEPGLTLLCLEGIALIALAVDVLAVQLRRAPLAGVPLLSMYAVAAAVVDGGVPWPLFVLLALGYLVLLVADGRLRVAQWGRSVTSSRRGTSGGADSSTLTRSGERVGALAIAVAVALPALVPGLANGVLGRGGSGDGSGGGSQTIQTTNPIVDLKRDLTQPDDVEVLRYRTEAAQPDYIRVVTLDLFDGESWLPSDRAIPSSQRVSEGLPEPAGLTSAVPSRERSYRFSISDRYRSSWLPLAYPPRSVEVDGDWRYDVASLDVVGRDGTTNGLDYEVTSLEVRPEDGQLVNAPSQVRGFERFLEVPDDVRAQLGPLADAQTAGAPNDYDQAVALQSWFRNDFAYSLDRPAGSSVDALTSFLQDRSGYCEQFAATMALMARTLGIPARVAVGFLPGSQEQGEWTVTARDAHAWPELYFDTVGWTRFEPTPAQRTGSAPAWTIPAAEAPDGAPDAANPGAVPGDPQTDPQTDPLDELGSGADPLARGGAGVDVPWRWVVTGIAVLLALALPAVTALVGRRVRWRRAAGDPTLQAEAAWDDLRDSARDAGFGWDPAATPRSAGGGLITRAGLTQDEGQLVRHVVAVAERARYAPTVPPTDDGLRGDSELLRRTLLAGAPRGRRLLARVWPASTCDVFDRIGERVADVLDLVDAAGGRVRRALAGVLSRGPRG